MSATCPLCGKHEPFWMDEPPTGCFDGGTGLCQQAMNNARAEAMRRKVAPEHFGPDGKMLSPPSRIAKVHDAMNRAGFDMWTGLQTGERLQ